MAQSTNMPLQTLMVYLAEDFIVTSGANFGDPLSFAEELIFDDIYQAQAGAEPARLALDMPSGGTAFKISPQSTLGAPGFDVYLDCAITFMAPDGRTFEALIFVEVNRGNAVGIYVLPLADIKAKTDYRLVGIDRKNALQSLALSASVAFTKGTHITLASGKQVPIEDLHAGDSVLTRNNGPQEIRWIGQNVIRAVGDFAPVRLRAGALNNTRDLILSPDHRLFVYQRSDKLNAGRNQVMIKARKLVNGDTVIREEGGFVEYYHLLFDDHFIIYAEGIAAESMLIDDRTQAALPDDMSETIKPHGETRHKDIEVTDLADARDLAEKLKEASAR